MNIATTTEMISDNIRTLEGLLADIQAAGSGSHGEAQAQDIMDKIHKRAAALLKATDDAHSRMCDIGRVFGV